MRILVTGVTGQLGGALQTRLKGLGTIIGVDRTALDLSRPEIVAAVLEEMKPNILVNPAAYTAVDKAEDEPALAMQVNSDSPGAMARWAANNDVPFIHFSTDYVFNGAGDRLWREGDEAQPLSQYGASKLAGEIQIRAAGGCFLIFRTSWLYAAKGSNFLRTIARLACKQTELKVVADQIGAPTSAALVADAVARILAGGQTELRAKVAAANGLVHLSASGEASWYLFATEIVEGLRSRGVRLAVERVVPIRSDQYPTRARRPLNSRFDLGRLKETFGITTPHWREALAAELDELVCGMP
jgi:dTDP-4-dehydrorhamnose reductase